MYKKHISKVPETISEQIRRRGQLVTEHVKRRAVAPYNFVELPNKVLSAAPFLQHNQYICSGADKRYTGKFKCTLTTESPLYIRNGLTPQDFKKHGDKSTSVEDLTHLDTEERTRRTDFFKLPDTQTPKIPGSSLRGMLRGLLEIVSFSKIDKVSDAQKIFFRAVAMVPKKDSIAAEYKFYINAENIRAGYLREDNQGWYIQPAREIKGHTFAWVKQTQVQLDSAGDLKKFDDLEYHPQYISVSFDRVDIDQKDRAKRFFAQNVGSLQKYTNKGQLVTSGNMKQGDGDSLRRNHCLVFQADSQQKDSSKKELRLDPIAVQHYLSSLTDFQKKTPFSEKSGLLEEDRAIFYYPPEEGQLVGFFGQSPNFRIPYSQKGNGHASTTKDFVPRDLQNPEVTDLTEAIFGCVKNEKQENQEQSFAGRVFVSDADYSDNTQGIWLTSDAISPNILAGPKPTTVAHYLVQPEETQAKQSELKHYANTLEETVIRGHKLYWHQGDVQLSKIKAKPSDINESESQYTEIKPVKSGVSFTFEIKFENLSQIELGALIWILSLNSDKSKSLDTGKTNEQYCLSLGMGKPLGMGAVKIDYDLYLSNRTQRYGSLFNGNVWNEAESTGALDQQKGFVKEFNDFILHPDTGISQKDHPKTGVAKTLREVPRIEMLLAMLRFDKTPPASETRYMKIEPNEYKDRRVLPTPLDIMDVEDNRRIPKASPSNKVKPSKPKPKQNKGKFNSPNERDTGFNPALQRGARPPKRK